MSDLRVTILQTCLPKYRVPVFRALAERPGLKLHLVYSTFGTIPNVAPDGFTGDLSRMRSWNIAGREVMWHGAELAWADKARTDVLVLPWHTGCLSLVPAMLKAAHNGVGVVLWGHGLSKHESPLRFGLRKKVIGLASCVLFYNNIAARKYIQNGVDSAKVFVALNTIDQSGVWAERDALLADPDRLAEFRRQQGLEGTHQVLFVSRLMEENRVDMLVEAAAILRSRIPGFRAVIVGKGPDQPRLEALAKARNVSEIVRFTGAIYDEDKIAPWFLTSDAYCYPANIGLSILHAFGYGLPVVTSDNLAAQNPEIEAMRDGENGLLYRDGDVEAMAAALRRLIEDAPLRERLGAEAYRTAHERFSIKNMVDGMEAAVRKAAGHGAVGG